MKFNKYWIIVSAITLANIFIFAFFSNKLESYMTDTAVEENQKLIESLK